MTESLANVLKHAGATRATVSLAYDDGRLQLGVADDGRGFDPDEASDGGLAGLRDRIRALGGTFTSPAGPAMGPASRRHSGGRAVKSSSPTITTWCVKARAVSSSRGGEVEVLAAVENTEALLDAVEQLRPDAVITDIRMPPTHQMERIEAAHAIRVEHPHVGVVVLSQYVNALYAFELFRDGTTGLAYLLKDRVGELDELLRALREVAAGGSVIDPKVVEGLLGRRQSCRDPPRVLAPASWR